MFKKYIPKTINILKSGYFVLKISDFAPRLGMMAKISNIQATENDIFLLIVPNFEFIC